MKNKIIFILLLLLIFISCMTLYIERTKADIIDERRQAMKQAGSYYNYLKKLSESNTEVIVSVVGSSVTKGSGATEERYSWPNRLVSALNNEINSNFTLLNYGFSRYKAEDLLKKNKIKRLVKQQPDFIIFETSVINNYRQSVSMEESLNYIDEVLNTLNKKVPKAAIVVISPNPIANQHKNEAGFTYEDYLNATEEHIKAKGHQYINIFNEMKLELDRRNLSADHFLKDGIHPNDEGYLLWHEILLEQLKVAPMPMFINEE